MDNVNDKHLVGDEIDDHKTELSSWIEKVTGSDIPTSRKGVADRFVRDCKTLMTDLDNENPPSCADLCDFDDRRRSLEVQFFNITQDSE